LSFGFFAVALLALAVSSSNTAVAFWAAPWIAAMLVLVIRAARGATVEFTDHEIVVRGVLKTRRIAWDEVRSVGVVPGSSAALVPWRVPCFELRDGTAVRIDEIRSLGEPSLVDAVVADARHRLLPPP